jgi:hypothetical protein
VILPAGVSHILNGPAGSAHQPPIHQFVTFSGISTPALETFK